AEQPDGAPDDGLTLTEVWGYGFELAQGGSLLLDEVRLKIPPPPLEITVTNLNDSGAGSLRQALADIASGGVVTFDPVLAGGTIGLTSGQLLAGRNVTVDASAAPGLVVSGSNISRVLTVAAGVTVTMNDLVVADGVGAPQGGGILNLGTLNLDRVVVRDNVETSSGPASFDFGGGAIYNGAFATLNLTDSTVANNASINQPGGGVYGFFNSTVNIVRSTISSNVSGDVAGGLRTLGNLTVVNSTIFGNVSTAWHGGAAFITDGTAVITNSTISGNSAPAGTAGGLMVATFGAPVSVTVTNSVVASNGDYDCQVEGGGAAVLTSGGSNVFADPSCNPVASDMVDVDPLLGPLADNGGPTLTQALLLGSPAIDSADDADCPTSDQRGVLRPQGAGCDVGAFEFEP
ncbi:MAG: right-handed parallel beta-helix repeat-containing protein, partial [Gammaproteobacteria bacterium]|nr:right-handed parallel beta-helix repeat-containing protein [Gammaproteobacteria bacterium]